MRTIRRLPLLATGAAFLAAYVAGGAGAASSGVTVTMDVASSTTIDATSCPLDTPSVTAFGTVLPGTGAVTGADCTIRFGSSNDTASLRIGQADRFGTGMWEPSHGVNHPTWGGGDALVSRDVNGSDHVTGAATAPDGSVVVAVDTSVGSQLRLIRFDANGVYDATFGVQTLQVYDSYFDRVGVAIQPDGKIVVASATASSTDTAIERRLATGGVDSSFGTGGLTTVNASTNNTQDGAYAVTVLDDGSVLAGGWANNGTGNGPSLIKLDQAGQLVPGFASGGISVLSMGGGDHGITDLAVMPDGRIVASGWRQNATFDAAVLRIRADGSFDPTFNGGSGWWQSVTASTDEGGGVAVLPDGRITFTVQLSDGTLRVGRLLASGTALDPTFGGGALVTPAITGGDWQYGIRRPLLLHDARVVLPGTVQNGGDADSALTRLRADGTLDPTFGTSGIARIDALAATTDITVAVLQGPDGSLRTAGTVGASGALDITATAFTSRQLPDYVDDATNVAGSDWGTPGGELFGACLVDASAGATGSWTEAGTCTMADGTAWRAVPVSAQVVATTAAPTTTARADLRFGVRVASARGAGSYVAPIAITVTAP